MPGDTHIGNVKRYKLYNYLSIFMDIGERNIIKKYFHEYMSFVQCVKCKSQTMTC